MPTFLAGKKARWSIGSRQLCENRWHQRESDENQRSNDILCLCLSYLYLCVGTCAVEAVSCVMCRMWYVLLHIRALFGCVNVPYISVYCKSIDSLPLFALIGTKDPDQSFLLGSPWESEWWSTIPGKTWTSKWRKETPVTWSNRKRRRAECHPNRSAELFSPPLSGFSAASGRELLPFVISSKTSCFCGEGRPCFFFLQVARG